MAKRLVTTFEKGEAEGIIWGQDINGIEPEHHLRRKQ
jgi:hypothetical protein